jgi:hypothetical protein
MEYFFVSLLDPVLVIPAFLIGCWPRGPLRLWLAGLFMASFPIIAAGYGVPTPSADDLLARALATATFIGIGWAVGRWYDRRSQPSS